jgi:hypothetical protein
MKFKSRSSRHETGESDQAAARWKMGEGRRYREWWDTSAGKLFQGRSVIVCPKR